MTTSRIMVLLQGDGLQGRAGRCHRLERGHSSVCPVTKFLESSCSGLGQVFKLGTLSGMNDTSPRIESKQKLREFRREGALAMNQFQVRMLRGSLLVCCRSSRDWKKAEGTVLACINMEGAQVWEEL